METAENIEIRKTILLPQHQNYSVDISFQHLKQQFGFTYSSLH